MLIEKIIDFKNYSVIWDEVWKIPEFNVLKYTQQNKTWHYENEVANHIWLTVKEMDKLIPYNGENGDLRLIMMLSALFHDIGKGATTFFSEEKKDWTSPNHDSVGEKITRFLLWDEDKTIRESVCYFVRNHMKPLYISESPTKVRNTIFLSCDSNNLRYCTNENLILLKTADCQGSIMTKEDKWRDKLDYAIMLAKEQNCYDKPYEFENNMSKFVYFNESVDEYPKVVPYDADFTAYVMIGLPGSGKTYYTTERSVYFNTIPHISRDDVRKELGIAKGNEKVVGNKEEEKSVTEITDKMMNEYCENKKSFVIDGINLNKYGRKQLVEKLRKYKCKIEFIYVERSKLNTNIEVRKEMMDGDKIIKMAKKIDYPSLTECFELTTVYHE